MLSLGALSFWNTTGSYTFQSWICGCPNWTKFSERVQKWDYVDKNRENLEFWTICCQIREILSLFSYQIAFWIHFCFNVQVNGISILQKRSWIESKLVIICEEKCFSVIFWILVSFWGQSFSKQLKNFEFFHHFASFFYVLLQKRQYSFVKDCCEHSYVIMSYLQLSSHQLFSISDKRSVTMSKIDWNFDSFDFLRIIWGISRQKSANMSSKKLTG